MVACGITRVIIFKWVIDFMTLNPMAWVMDTTWYSSGVLFWHNAENVVDLLGCCLPSYRPLFRKVITTARDITKSASSGSSYPHSGRCHAEASYHKQQDQDWPVTQGADTKYYGVTGVSRGEVGGYEHELDVSPQNQILVRTEFQAVTSMV